MNLFSQIKSFGNKLFKDGPKLGQKVLDVVNMLGNKSGNILNKITTSTGLKDVAKELNKVLKDAAGLANGILKLLPPESRKIVENVYRLSPVGRALESVSEVSKIIAGEKPISEDLLINVFPAYKELKNEASKIIDMNIRKLTTDAITQEATKLLIGLAVQKASGGAVVL